MSTTEARRYQIATGSLSFDPSTLDIEDWTMIVRDALGEIKGMLPDYQYWDTLEEVLNHTRKPVGESRRNLGATIVRETSPTLTMGLDLTMRFSTLYSSYEHGESTAETRVLVLTSEGDLLDIAVEYVSKHKYGITRQTVRRVEVKPAKEAEFAKNPELCTMVVKSCHGLAHMVKLVRRERLENVIRAGESHLKILEAHESCDLAVVICERLSSLYRCITRENRRARL